MPPKQNKIMKEVKHNEQIFRIGDACLVNPETSHALPFIGKIVEIQQFGPKPDDIKINVVWYYRPEEALGGRKHATFSPCRRFMVKRSCFDSDHPDEIHKNTIIGKCFVHTLRKYESLATIKDQDFFTRFFYRPGKKEFEPDQVPVYCDCEQPYNPDKPMVMCEECEDWSIQNALGYRRWHCNRQISTTSAALLARRKPLTSA